MKLKDKVAEMIEDVDKMLAHLTALRPKVEARMPALRMKAELKRLNHFVNGRPKNPEQGTIGQVAEPIGEIELNDPVPAIESSPVGETSIEEMEAMVAKAKANRDGTPQEGMQTTAAGPPPEEEAVPLASLAGEEKIFHAAAMLSKDL